MGGHRDSLVITTTEIEIHSSCQRIPEMDGIDGGVVCTGFIDIEKIIRRVKGHPAAAHTTHFFLEKKLPFQVLLIAFEGSFGESPETGTEDCTGSETGTSSGSSSCGSDSDSDSDSEESGDCTCTDA